MRLRILFFAVLFCSFAQAQELGEQELKVSDFTPPSPEAYAMTKYGDLQPDEFNGMVNYSLPLYTYTAGNVEVPITLNYTGAGVKVNDVPTWVGINMRLQAGGVITRTVKDLPDENAVHRVFTTMSDLESYNDAEDGSTASDILQDIIAGDQYDSEVDIFQFSFGGYSGSFYLDENWEAHLLKKDTPLKIGIVDQFNQSHALTITTPDGIIYHFGGNNAIENTVRRYVVDDSVTPNDTNEGITAFYLTQIEHPINGVVNLEYLTNGSPQIVVSQKIEKYRKFLSVTLPSVLTPCGPTDDKPDYCFATTQYICTNAITDYLSKWSNVTVSTRTYNARYLHRITSINSQETVTFESHGIDNTHFNRILDRIVVRKTNDSSAISFKTIDFEYLGKEINPMPFGGYSDISKRIFLSRVIFDKENPDADNTQQGRRNEVFKFEYNACTALPERFSNEQDFLGYYNGKPNVSAVPDTNEFNPFGASGFADRNPDFSYAAKGTLTDIYYPTGGRTHFDYEAKKAKQKIFVSKHLYAYRNMAGFIPPDKLSDMLPQWINPDSLYQIVNIYESQQVSINVRLVVHDEITFPQRDFVTVRLTNLITLDQDEHVINMPSPSGDMGTVAPIILEESIPYVFAQGGSYKIEIIINDDTISEDTRPMEAYLSVKYCDGYEIVDDTGVLLARQTDFAADGEPENIKRIYYSDVNHIVPVLAELPLTERDRYNKTEKEIIQIICNPNICCDGGGGLIDIVYEFKWLLSDFIDISTMPDMGIFEHVTVSLGGDNFENGGVEKTFHLESDISAMQIETFPIAGITDRRSYFDGVSFGDIHIQPVVNGTVLQERYFKNEGNTLKKILEKSFTYDFSTPPSEYTINIIATKMYDILFYAPNTSYGNITSNYYIAQYLLPVRKSQVITKSTTEYIDPVPYTVTDESAYRKIVTTEDYQYDSYAGQPTRIAKSTSENAVTVETHHYYVDTGSVNGLPGGTVTSAQQDAYTALEQANIVWQPVQTESWYNGVLTARQRTLYADTPDTDVYLDIFPNVIQASKGEHPLEDRVEFLEYGAFGPVLVALKGGAKTRYSHNSRGQVVLKIENWPDGGMVPAPEIGQDYEGGELVNCDVHQTYPDSFVTRWYYNSNGDLIKTLDANCRQTTYEYDALHRLRVVRDHDGNLVKSFDTNFDKY